MPEEVSQGLVGNVPKRASWASSRDMSQVMLVFFASSPVGSYRVFTGPALAAGGGRMPEKVSQGLVGDVPKRASWASSRDMGQVMLVFFAECLKRSHMVFRGALPRVPHA
jgi:hypothetical protein